MATLILRVALLAVALTACRGVDPRDPHARAAAARGEPVQTVYSDDAGDPWNRLFSEMFTRTVQLRKTSEFADAGPFARLGEDDFRRFPVSTRTFDRFEDGDRAIPPFYPSFIHVQGISPALTAQRLEALDQTLTHALADTRPRTPVDRVLMQADLWAVFDRLGPRDPQLPRRQTGLSGEIERVTPLLARMIAKLALTRDEIAALPDQYALARETLDLPNLFSPAGEWQEIVWFDDRMHDVDTGFRQATRVFVRPSKLVNDRPSFFDDLRFLAHGPSRPEPGSELRSREALSKIDGVALVMQMLAIDRRGEIDPTPLVYTVQTRMFERGADGSSTTVAIEHELSRKRLRTHPEAGGFRTFRGADPGYIPSAGNDYSFAQPHFGSVREPILGTLDTRCSSCHGAGPHLFTFSQTYVGAAPPVTLLRQPNDTRVRFVTDKKRVQEDFKRLRALWR
jgi:hypothetical protein